MKIMVLLLVLLYLYTLSFGIFLTESFRVPAPLVFCLPLVVLFRERSSSFLYSYEVVLFSIAIFAYSVIGLNDVKGFAASVICILLCALFFSYFVGNSLKRFNCAVGVFFGLLTFSSVIMVFNPFYPDQVNVWRSALMGEPVIQSPSGIAVYQFNFGYQLASLTPFVLIATFVFKMPVLLKAIGLILCLLFIYLGMQRSVLVGFSCAGLLFLWIYYKYRSVLMVASAVAIGILFYSYFLKDNLNTENNILTKNEHNMEEYNRSLLLSENLNIYSDYPCGLIFYGKDWADVIYRNKVFSSGITSHNAYMMFLTYLGPFFGLALLIGIYYKVIKVIAHALGRARQSDYALMICLCCAFISVSVNSLSHNSWLVSANGPTIFLYFSILHLDYLMKEKYAQ